MGLAAVCALSFAILGLPHHPDRRCPVPSQPDGSAGRAGGHDSGDVVNLPVPLKNRLGQVAARNHTYLPLQAFAEADQPSQLFQYYLLDSTGFEPNVFTAVIRRERYRHEDCGGRELWRTDIASVRLVLSQARLPTGQTTRALHRVFTTSPACSDQQRERLVRRIDTTWSRVRENGPSALQMSVPPRRRSAVSRS